MSDLRYSTHQIDEDDIAAVVRTLRSDWLTQGPEVQAFEEDLCAYTGARYAVAVSSGTAALHLCMLALGKTVESGMVLTSPLSFVASANAALLAGHDVDFCDVDRATGLMRWKRTLSRSGRRFTIAVPVHYAGRCCDLEMMQGPLIVEDAAHAFGATCFDGCGKVGNCAHSLAACFSFHAVKSVTCGEGGAIVSNDQGFADEVRMLRSHGRDAAAQMVALAPNYRLTDFQAALGRSQLERLDAGVAHRAELAAIYVDLLRHVDGVQCPEPMPKGAWHLYTVRVDPLRREGILAGLRERGVLAQKHYSPPIHLQPYYVKTFGYRAGSFPESEAWAASEISLPLHVGMKPKDATRVVEALSAVL